MIYLARNKDQTDIAHAFSEQYKYTSNLLQYYFLFYGFYTRSVITKKTLTQGDKNAML
jgi:hypothetical protein